MKHWLVHSKLHGLAFALLCAWTVLAAAAPVVLYEKQSIFGPVTVKEDDAGMRTLHFGRDGVRQSAVKPGDPDHLELPYAKVVMAGLALSAHKRRFLVVGLGGGSVPVFLRAHYPKAVIDAVDIDPEVVNVAREYFGFREDAGMRAHVADGRKFIEAVREPYDVVFLDAFGSDSVPEHLTTLEFLRAVRRSVAPDGVVVGNIWGPHANRLYHSMVRTYREAFAEVVVLDVQGAGNKILLALPRRQSLGRDELINRAHRLSVEQAFRFDLGTMVGYGFEQRSDPSGRILRDRNLGKLE